MSLLAQVFIFLWLSFCDMNVPSKSNVMSLWPWPLNYEGQYFCEYNPTSILYKFQINIEIKYQNIGRTHTETDRQTHTHRQTDMVKTIPRYPLRGRGKYLGVFITSDLSDNIDMTRHMRSLYARANILLRKFNTCSIDIMKTLFQLYCTHMYCPTYGQITPKWFTVKFQWHWTKYFATCWVTQDETVLALEGHIILLENK